MKSTYIAINNYGTGAVFYRLFAESKEDVERLFPSPGWKVYAEGDMGCPEGIRDRRLVESDVDEPEEWLQKHVWRQSQQEKGRSPFYFESGKGGDRKYLEVWADSEAQVLLRYPTLESTMYKCQTEEIIAQMILCDIDTLGLRLLDA